MNDFVQSTAKRAILPVAGFTLTCMALPFVAAHFALFGVAAVALGYANSFVIVKALTLLSRLAGWTASRLGFNTGNSGSTSPTQSPSPSQPPHKPIFPDFSGSGFPTRTDNAERYSARDEPDQGQFKVIG